MKVQKSKAPNKKHRRSLKMKVQEKEMKQLEAVLADMRELNNMERADQWKSKAKLRKLERKNSETKKANGELAMNDARIQLCIDAMLDLFDD